MPENFQFTLKRVSEKSHLLADAAELALLFEEETLHVASPEIKDILTEGGLDNRYENDDSGDNLECITASCFEQLKYRMGAFGTNYPFTVKEGNALKLCSNQDMKHPMLYVFLLVASRLKSFSSQSFSNHMATEFEQLSCEAVKQLLPKSAEVICFGSGSKDRKKIGNKLIDAVPKLAKMIGANLRDGWESKFPDLVSSADLQIDVAGAVKFDDEATGHLAILAQCKAQEEDWKKGTANIVEATKKKSRLFDYAYSPQTALFISPCYRQSNGKWVDETHTQDMMLVDRLRIVKLLEGNEPIDFVKQRLNKLACHFPTCGIARLMG